MAKSVQDDFFKWDREYGPNRLSHGGSASVGKRKIRRPFRRNRAMHVTLKSSIAKEKLSLLGPRFRLPADRIITQYANRFGIKVHAVQNVGNHIHAVVTAKTLANFQIFLKAISSLIAQLVTGARRGRPSRKRFWDHAIFTRILSGPRHFKAMINYVFKNHLEAEVSPMSRKSVELWELAERKARRTGKDIWNYL